MTWDSLALLSFLPEEQGVLGCFICFGKLGVVFSPLFSFCSVLGLDSHVEPFHHILILSSTFLFELLVPFYALV